MQILLPENDYWIMLHQDADGAKALADAAGKLTSKQEAFDQLNTLFAEQALRLSQADDKVR